MGGLVHIVNEHPCFLELDCKVAACSYGELLAPFSDLPRWCPVFCLMVHLARSASHSLCAGNVCDFACAEAESSVAKHSAHLF